MPISAAAALAERRASGAAAGCSAGAGAGAPTRAAPRPQSRRLRRAAAAVVAAAVAGGGGGPEPSPQPPRGAPQRAAALAAADYGFYARLREGEVTEEWLWEHRLAPVLGYLPDGQARLVREALSLAFDAHAGQRRRSGEPFITHPVEVARILAELRVDHESLVAGLLHDTVEDCGDVVGLEEIEFGFGPAVRRIVEGETKFSKLPTHHPESRNIAPPPPGAPRWRTAASVAAGGAPPPPAPAPAPPAADESPDEGKARDLQFLFLAMTEEVRIVVVKLADRLHNMRTMGAMPPGKQRRIAQETLAVFAPLARLLGLYTVKEELEDLAFRYASPQQYALLARHADRLWAAQAPLLAAAREQLAFLLEGDQYLAARVAGVRVETHRRALYSVWRKLQQAGRSVRDVTDIAQLRVVLEPAAPPRGLPLAYSVEKQLCYHVMGLVHAFWAPVPGAVKDYIATPKSNAYQSLHTTVLPTGLRITAADEGGGAGGGAGGGGAPPPPRGAKARPTLFPIEIQIRTREMNRLAEYGIAVESWSCADYSRAAQRGGAAGGGAVVQAAAGGNGAAAQAAAGGGADAAAAAGEGDARARLPFGLGKYLYGADGAGANGAGGSNGASANGGGAAAYADFAGAVVEAGDASALPDDDGGAAPGGGAPLPDGWPPLPDAGAPGGRLDPQSMSRRINWLNSIRAWQAEFVGTLSASEFVACVTDDLLGAGVFVFTPSGQVMRLPKGATALDFAYHIHTDVGNTMLAARVNGKVVPASHELANAEVVEVITYRGPASAAVVRRHAGWLGAARTKSARHKLARFLREHAALGGAEVAAAVDGADDDGAYEPGGGAAAPAPAPPPRQAVWLDLACADRRGLLADIAAVIARHRHNIRSYSGAAEPGEPGAFRMRYELEGAPGALGDLCDDLACTESVRSWAAGCPWPPEEQQEPGAAA